MASWGRGSQRRICFAPGCCHLRRKKPHLTETTAMVLKVVLISAGHILFPQLNTIQEGFLAAGGHTQQTPSLTQSS